MYMYNWITFLYRRNQHIISKMCVCVCGSRSVMSNSLQPQGLYIACQAPRSMEFSRPEYWSG